MKQVESQKHDMLLAWFNSTSKHQGRVSMDEFDKRYQWLFRRRPLFYSWGSFYRDHSLVGLRQ